MKTDEQIAAEIAKLEEMKPRVRRYSLFGDSHHAAIDAQVRVLRERLTIPNVEYVFDVDIGVAENVYENAHEAAAWWTEDAREDFPESLADEWQELVVKR